MRYADTLLKQLLRAAAGHTASEVKVTMRLVLLGHENDFSPWLLFHATQPTVYIRKWWRNQQEWSSHLTQCSTWPQQQPDLQSKPSRTQQTRDVSASRCFLKQLRHVVLPCPSMLALFSFVGSFVILPLLRRGGAPVRPALGAHRRIHSGACSSGPGGGSLQRTPSQQVTLPSQLLHAPAGLPAGESAGRRLLPSPQPCTPWRPSTSSRSLGPERANFVPIFQMIQHKVGMRPV